MQHSRTLFALVGLTLVIAACSAGAGDDPSDRTDAQPSSTAPSSAAAGDLAPDVELEFFDGSVAILADFRGRPVVVNFWASWCPACIAEMPDFESVHQRVDGAVVFIGVDMQDIDRSTASRFVADTGVTYRIADDPTGEVFAAFGGFAMPTTVFIDENGAVVARQNGAIFEDQLAEMISEVFGIDA